MKTVADIGEDELVRRLTRRLASRPDVISGAGDDCAVVAAPSKGRVLLLKTDCVVEGVHFTTATPPRWVGRKALARVLSDIASMGGTPEHALVSLLLPGSTTVRYVEGVYAGMNALAQCHGVAIVGGETSRGPVLSITIALTGSALARGWMGRGGAKVGDRIFVTGRLGGSIGGRHLKFEPRLEQGRWLAQHFRPTAMMDLSDGLAKDLPRLARRSGVSYAVTLESLPAHKGCTAQQAWGDGEDYELLFTLPARREAKLLEAWRAQFPKLALTCIGEIVPASAPPQPPLPGGWDPFV